MGRPLRQAPQEMWHGKVTKGREASVHKAKKSRPRQTLMGLHSSQTQSLVDTNSEPEWRPFAPTGHTNILSLPLPYARLMNMPHSQPTGCSLMALVIATFRRQQSAVSGQKPILTIGLASCVLPPSLPAMWENQ